MNADDPITIPLVAHVASDLERWWLAKAQEEIDRTVPKSKEYGAGAGSYDLELVGRVLADMVGWDSAPSRVQAEMGCFFYALGKLGRMAAAYRQQELPSDDNVFDLRVYMGMIMRIREVGRWP